MYSKMIDKYIRDPRSNYKAKYVYHSCDRIDMRTFKFHYYVRDRQLLQMNIFLEISLQDEVIVTIREDIHEDEQWALACDALERIRAYTNRKTTLTVDQIPSVVENKIVKGAYSPQDIINIFNYIMYHEGKHPDSIYMFYESFIPYLEVCFENKDYKKVMTTLNWLFEDVLNETVWQTFNIKYLDQEHTSHRAYAATILKMIHEHFLEIYTSEKQLLCDYILKIFQHWRFAFASYASLEKMTMDYRLEMKKILNDLKDVCLYSTNEGTMLVYDIIEALVLNDEKKHRQSMIEIVKLLMDDILTFSNPEEQKETGLHFLMMVGFDLLLEIFDQTKDAYVYVCFKVDEIPVDFHPYIKKQLIATLYDYAKDMKNPSKRMHAYDQIASINRILIQYFDVY